MTKLDVPCDFWDLDATGVVQPGVLLHLANGRLVLVGHVNVLGGVCDECTDPDLQADVLVVAYEVVWGGAEQ